VGQLVAMLFLVSLFITPVQWGVEVLNEAQNAISGWRRVIGLLEAVPDVPDPGTGHGEHLPAGAVGVAFEHVGFAYPGSAPVLHDVDVAIPPRARVAVVGETGSGKTTFAKLLTRLMDPVGGGAAAGRPRAGPHIRSRPAAARRGHLGRGPGDRTAAPAGARRADPGPHHGGDRAPALDRAGRRRGAGLRRRSAGRARPPRRP